MKQPGVFLLLDDEPFERHDVVVVGSGSPCGSHEMLARARLAQLEHRQRRRDIRLDRWHVHRTHGGVPAGTPGEPLVPGRGRRFKR
jgi:hypothetical protein